MKISFVEVENFDKANCNEKRENGLQIKPEPFAPKEIIFLTNCL